MTLTTLNFVKKLRNFEIIIVNCENYYDFIVIIISKKESFNAVVIAIIGYTSFNVKNSVVINVILFITILEKILHPTI